MNISIGNAPRATQVVIDEENLHITLSDRRRLSVPLDWFPRLANATTAQRQNWEMVGRGIGIHWEEIDRNLCLNSAIRKGSASLRLIFWAVGKVMHLHVTCGTKGKFSTTAKTVPAVVD
jgi:hypothetical protein